MRLGRVRRMGRRGVAALVVVLLAVAGTGAWLLTRPSGPRRRRPVTATVAAGTYQQTVSATGTLEPTRQADLDFAVSGRVTAGVRRSRRQGPARATGSPRSTPRRSTPR